MVAVFIDLENLALGAREDLPGQADTIPYKGLELLGIDDVYASIRRAYTDWSFFFSSRRRQTRWNCDWSSDVCSSDLLSTSRQALVSRRRWVSASARTGSPNRPVLAGSSTTIRARVASTTMSRAFKAGLRPAALT